MMLTGLGSPLLPLVFGVRAVTADAAASPPPTGAAEQRPKAGALANTKSRTATVLGRPEHDPQSIFQRDGYTCRFCGVVASVLCAQSPTLEGDRDSGPAASSTSFDTCLKRAPTQSRAVLAYFRAVLLESLNADVGPDYATACPLCFSIMDLQQTAKRDGAIVTWCPELTQAEIQALAHVCFDAAFAGRPERAHCVDLYDAIADRSAEAEAEWGNGSTDLGNWARELAKADLSFSRRHEQIKGLRGVRLLPKPNAHQAYFQARILLADALNAPNDITRVSWQAMTVAADARADAANALSAMTTQGTNSEARTEAPEQATTTSRPATHLASASTTSAASLSGAAAVPLATSRDTTVDVSFVPDLDALDDDDAEDRVLGEPD